MPNLLIETGQILILYQQSALTSYNKAADRPGVVHGHPQVDLPLPCSHLHGPHEGSSVAGDGHGPRDPPGQDEQGVPGHHHVVCGIAR